MGNIDPTILIGCAWVHGNQESVPVGSGVDSFEGESCTSWALHREDIAIVDGGSHAVACHCQDVASVRPSASRNSIRKPQFCCGGEGRVSEAI